MMSFIMIYIWVIAHLQCALDCLATLLATAATDKSLLLGSSLELARKVAKLESKQQLCGARESARLLYPFENTIANSPN